MKRSLLIAKLTRFVKPLAPVMLITITIGVCGFLSAIGISVASAYGALVALKLESGSLGVIFALLAVFAVARGLLRYIEQYSGHYIAFRLLALFRDKIFSVLRTLAPAKLENRSSGDLVAMVTADIEALEVFYAHTIAPVAIAILVSLAMTLFIGSFSWVQGVLAACAYLVVSFFAPKLQAKHTAGQAYRSEFGKLMSYFLDSIRGLREVLQFNAGEERLSHIRDASNTLNGITTEAKSHENRVVSLSDLLVLFFSLAMCVVSVLLYRAGKIDFCGMLIPTVAMFSSFGAVIAVSNLSHDLVNTFAAAERVFALLEEKPSVEEIPGEYTGTFVPSVTLENVTFAYETETILDQFNLNVTKGEFVGLKGASGSGKSTILKLIMRFWQADAGKVTVSSKSIDTLPTKTLRKKISFMSQETYLFNDTILDNIRIGKADATEQQVIDAAKKASVHDFIAGLEKGYDTRSGELGDRFSSGERQRIGLARMFLHDAPIMLLDEPTSNIDILNENIVMKSLAENSSEKTILVVSHKASTLVSADRIVTIGADEM